MQHSVCSWPYLMWLYLMFPGTEEARSPLADRHKADSAPGVVAANVSATNDQKVLEAAAVVTNANQGEAAVLEVAQKDDQFEWSG